MTKAARRSVKAASPKDQPTTDEAGHLREPAMPPAETAQYIAEFTAELSFLARKTNLDLLAYLLDMARLEAIRALQANDRR